MKKLILLLFAFTLGWRSEAEILLRPALGYSIDKTEQNPPPTTTTRRLIDVAFGYLTAEGWGIIGLYGTENRKIDNGSTTSNEDRTSIGAGGGYFSKAGFYIDGIYFLSNEWNVNGATYKGNGYQIDVGWKFDIGKTGVGLQMSYKAFNYTKLDSASLSPPYKKTNLDPMFALFLLF